MRQVGATIGVAVLGTVLSTVYRSHLAGRPARRGRVGAARAASWPAWRWRTQTGSAALLDSVRHAFVRGMDTMLWVCAGIALVSAMLALIFLPRRADGAARPVAGAADAVLMKAARAGRIGSETEQ